MSSKEQKDYSKTAEMLPEPVEKHPLQNTWTFWFIRNDRNKSWEDNLTEISTFDTVEDFWALYNHIEIASKLPTGCDYCLFKCGIKPMWEDERNKRGGKWFVSLQKHSRNLDLSNTWLEMLMCLVGEAFDDYGDEICGAVVQNRYKADKLGLWTSDFRNKDAVIKIGQIFKDRLHIPRGGMIAYEAHNAK